MNFEEKQILDFLKPHPRVFFSVSEIAKKAGSRRQFQMEPEWPKHYLQVMCEQGLLATNPLGHYCYRPDETKKKRRFVLGPHVARFRPEKPAEATAATPASAPGATPSASPAAEPAKPEAPKIPAEWMTG